VSEEDAPDYNKIIEVTIFYSSNRWPRFLWRDQLFYDLRFELD
jgi:hypothetical protein